VDVEARNGEKRFDMLVLNFLINKYHFKTRLVDLENRELRSNEINNLLKQAEIEADAVVCFMDMDFILKYASPAHDTLYGEKAIGESNTDHAHPEDLTSFMLTDAVEAIEKKKNFWLTFRYKGGSGKYLKVKSKCFPVVDDDGIVNAIFTISDLAPDDAELGVKPIC
jgi:hypothetical protein